MDGRDIGTVVLPQAELKVFMIASVEARHSADIRNISAKELKQITRKFTMILKNVIIRIFTAAFLR